MSRRLFCALVIFFAPLVGSTSAAEIQPQWVNCRSEADALGEGFMRRTFAVEQPVTSATLRACGDGTFVDLFIGGKRIAELEPYDPVLQVDVTESCQQGRIAIAMQLRGSPPLRCAAFVQIDLKFADRTESSLVTDDSWRCQTAAAPGWIENDFDDSAWQPPTLLGTIDDRLLTPPQRSTDIEVAENYDQWKQAIGANEGTDPASFQLIDGFEIELLRSAQKDEDSWVSMVVDAKGRLIIGKEKVGLLRLTLNAAGTIDQVETINDTMKECRGLLFVGDDLYVNANNSKGLYRLPARDANLFGEPELVYESSGGVGHGRNDLTLGPDGKIYSIQGDSVDLPIDAPDYTSPFREARRGIKTSEGHLLRIDPQTSAVEVLVGGLRNPFGIAFNPRGDCFTYDADAEYDMGAPWYRPTRVNHLTLGSDFGWRGVTKQWPPYYPDHPDNAVPGFSIGKGSPTAVKFGTQSNFPARYREALFILDWTYGRVVAVHTLPRGSSYMMMAETFLQGRPLNVTDLDFGPDGSMYLVTGGRATQSALYRIRYTGPESSESPLTEQQQHRQSFANAAHAARRQLEAKLTDSTPGMTAELGSDDPWIRASARHLLEQKDVSEWRQSALAESDNKVALSAMLSLARSGDKRSRARIIERLCEIDWPTMSRSWRETVVYTLALCTERWDPPAKLKAELISRLESSYPDREFSVNRIVSELLVRLDSRVVVATTLDLATDTGVQAEQMHYLFVLRNAQLGWTPKHRRTYFRLLAGTRDYIGGQGMNDFLTKIRSDAIESLGSDVQETFEDVIRLSDPTNDVTPIVSVQRPIIAQWTHETLTAALAKVGGERDVSRGKQLFAEAACVHCHRVGGYGRLIGPDLTNVSRRFSRHDLLTSMLEPSKVIPEKYQSLQVVTKDGRVFVGIPALGGDYRSTKLRLATSALDPYAITEIEKQEIEATQPSQTSWMPNGLLNTLTAEEVADLLAYLNSSRLR